MNIPVGMSEKEVLSTIEKVVNRFAVKYKFGSYEADDLRQEGFLECIRKIDRFKPETGSLENFLCIVVRNRYINLKRNEYLRRVETCDAHPTFVTGCSDCKRRQSSEGRNTAKLNVIQPIGIDNINDENESNTHLDCKLYDMLLKAEINQLIDKYLPSSLRPDYIRFLQNVKMPKQRLGKVIRAIQEILGEYYDGEAW